MRRRQTLWPRSSRPTCECCGKGKLELINERPDPIFGVLGVICQTLKCDFLSVASSQLSEPAGDRNLFGHQSFDHAEKHPIPSH